MSLEGISGGGMVKIPMFDGTKFPMYKLKMKAVLNIKGCAPALDKSFANQLPSSESVTLDESKEDEKKQKKALEKNALGMNIMTLSMETEGLMAKVSASATPDFPSGLLWKLWEALEAEYEPNDTIAEAELLCSLMKLKLNRVEDPKSLGERMCAIQARYKTTVTEAQKVAVVVNSCGDDYAETLRQEQRTLKAFGNDVTSAALIQAMHDKWRIGGGGKKNENEASGGKEVAMSAVQKGDFKGVCRNCKKVCGYKAADCPEKNSESQGEYCKCGKGKRHLAKDCWEKEENAPFRPKWWESKVKNEASGTSVEICIAAVDVPVEVEAGGVELSLASVESASCTNKFEVTKTADSFSCDCGASGCVASVKAHSLSGDVASASSVLKAHSLSCASEANSFGDAALVASCGKVVSVSEFGVVDPENVERGRVSEGVVSGAQPSSVCGNFKVESMEGFRVQV